VGKVSGVWPPEKLAPTKENRRSGELTQDGVELISVLEVSGFNVMGDADPRHFAGEKNRIVEDKAATSTAQRHFHG
jgi:hypothetical protein